MKAYERILISVFLLMYSVIMRSNIAEAQEANQLILSVLEKEVAISGQNQSISLLVRIVNQNTKKYKLLLFCNQWEVLRNTNFIPVHVFPGFNVAVFNDDGKILFPPLRGVSHSQSDHPMKVFVTKGPDSALVAAGKLIAKLEALVQESEQKIRDSAQWISPGDTLETVLDIDLLNYGLTKGKYCLEIYYVMNKKIFRYTEKSDDLLMGYLKSNRIELTVD